MRPALPLSMLLLACPSETGPPWSDCEVIGPEHAPEEADGWYRCLDESLEDGGCGDAGYPLGWGGKYARKYMVEVHPELSEDGRAFLEGVLVCLQETLRDGLAPDATCEDVADLGFASHVPCYRAHAFCSIPLTDMARIWAAIDEADRGLPAQEAAMATIRDDCLDG